MGSVIARGCMHAGLSLKRMLENIFERTRSYNSFLMPSSFQRLGVLTSKSAEEILDGHTVFPYSVAYMPNEQRERLRKKALALNLQTDCLGSLTKSVSYGVPYRRVCPECLKADFEDYGEPYWHRSHLLPAVHTCAIHGTRLRETNVPLKLNANECRISFPSEAVQKSITKIAPSYVLDALTEVSIATFNAQAQASKDSQKVYRSEALARGYCIEGGAVASMALSVDIGNFYGCELLQDCGCSFKEGATGSWPSLMARERPGVPFSPAKHVLMETFFNLKTESVHNVTVSYSMPGRKADDCESLDEMAEKELRLRLRKATIAGTRLTVQELLRSVGVWEKFRHHRERFPKTNKVIQDFRASDQSERQLGKRKAWRKKKLTIKNNQLPL